MIRLKNLRAHRTRKYGGLSPCERRSFAESVAEKGDNGESTFPIQLVRRFLISRRANSDEQIAIERKDKLVKDASFIYVYANI